MSGLGLTIGGWFGSAFVSVLVEKASSFALRLLGPRSDLQDEINRLTISLCAANAVLRLAERKRTYAAHNDLAFIVALLRDAAYDAEDLLADLDYEILRRKIEGPPHQAGNFLSSPLSFAPNLPNSNLDGDVASKARGVRERLDAVSEKMRDIINFLNLEDAVGRSQHEMLAPKRESSSLPTEPQMIGRDEEKETLIQLLLRSPADGSGSSTPDRNVSVLPILGIGGVGKTTLAQFVYHDPRVQEYFKPMKMWVCVSNQPFDVKRLTKEILEAIDRNERYDLTNLDSLQVTLKEKVTSKRYLLVLDDVWNEDGREWKRLYAPLKYGLQGSTIIVTARSRKVVEVMTGALDPIILKGLPKDDFWKFFKTCAFGSDDSAGHPEMQEIAKLIMAKLKGSPLAAKTLGGLLNSNMDVRHWRTIMNSEIWELQQDENDIMPALRLSYEYLPSHLKRCFSFCSIYPQDYKLDASKLVELWMAQGFTEPQANMLLEDVGNRYLLDLASRSFFQKDQWSDYFQVHDLMHDLAQYVSKNECFRIQNDRQGIPSSIRHLSIVCTENLKLHEVMDSGNFSKLRSLVYFSGTFLPKINPAIERWLDQLQYIRVLILGFCNITELPESIGNLKHLRFLKMSSNSIKRLPESFCRLYNLQVLDVDECPLLKRLPRGFTNLVNLRKLRAADELVSRVTEIGRLTNLQNLNRFEVRKEHGFRIDELKKLNQLHGWLNATNLENVESKDDARQANLDDKEYINALTLEWYLLRYAFFWFIIRDKFLQD